MITPNELRIGNYVQSKDRDGDGSIVRVDAIDDQGINYYVSTGGYEHEMIFAETDKYDWYWPEPISITSEILEKCGFKNYPRPDHEEKIMRDLFFLNIGTMDITFHMGETLLVVGNSGGIKSGQVILNNSLKYLHQLQNLFFSLTNKELEIKL